MRWPERIAGLLAALAVSLVAAAAAAEPESAEGADDLRAARLATVERTIDLIAARERDERARLAARVRAFYKIERPAAARLWVEPSARLAWHTRRAALARLLRRDAAEIAILAGERRAALSERERAGAELAADSPRAADLPARSLVRPVPGRIATRFGERRDPTSRAALVDRGVGLACRPGDAVLAVADGRVAWTGPLAGGQTGLLIEHEPTGGPRFLSILVGLRAVALAPGAAVTAGQPVAQAAGDALHVEIRLRSGVFGHPVDPAPLFRR